MLIGVVGYAGSGKDEVAKHLEDKHGFRRFAFADRLKEIAYDLNPWIDMGDGTFERLATLVDLLGWDEAKKIPAVREFLQDLGMVVRRSLGEDTWVDIVRKDIVNSAVLLGRDAVVTDVRFHNEIRMIKDRDGKIVRVARIGVGPVNDHVSEHEWNDVQPDFTITNDGDLDWLHESIEGMLTELRRGLG